MVSVLTGCGGSHRATVAVGVADPNGKPVSGAAVSISGTGFSTTSDASGNARLSGLKPGIYDVSVSAEGHYDRSTSVTVSGNGSPQPVSVALEYAPPVGTFISQPSNEEWDQVTIGQDGNDVVTVFRWFCGPIYDSNGNTDHWEGQWQQTRNSGFGQRFLDQYSISPIGPDQLDTSWSSGPPPRDVTNGVTTNYPASTGCP